MKRCMYCGNENDDSSQNCSKCGNQLMDLPPQQAMMAEEVPEDGSIAEEMTFGADAPDIKISEEALEEEPRYPWQQNYEEPQSFAPPKTEPAVQEPLQNAEPLQEDLPESSEPLKSQEAQSYEAEQDKTQNGYDMPQFYAEQNYEQPDIQQQYGGQAYGYAQPAQQYGQAMPPQDGHPYGKMQSFGNGGSQQLMQTARKWVKSPLFFLVVLLYTAAVVSSIINVVSGNVVYTLNAFQSLIQSALGSSMAISFLNGIIDLAEGLSSSLLILGGGVLSLPGILICLGMWMAFLFTRRDGDEISTAGYTMVKGMVLLEFIGWCLVLTVGLIISVAFVVAAGAASSTASIIVGIILLIVMIIISSVMVLFYVQFLHALKVIRRNAKDGADLGCIALFVPVMGLLGCIFKILMMLPMAPDDILGLVSLGTSAAWILFGSIWLLIYRSKTRR